MTVLSAVMAQGLLLAKVRLVVAQDLTKVRLVMAQGLLLAKEQTCLNGDSDP